MRNDIPYIIGVTGASGSGKTHFSADLINSLTSRGITSTLLPSDEYYKETGPLTDEELKRYNFCVPESLDFPLLERHLLQLSQGHSIERPIYDMATNAPLRQTMTLKPAQVIVIEGLLIFSSPVISSLCHTKVYIDLDFNVCTERRLRRDQVERKKSPESILARYPTEIIPSFFQYTQPAMNTANLVLHHDQDKHAAIQALTDILATHFGPQPPMAKL